MSKGFKKLPFTNEERLPYNPFPLATLRATGLSARAKHIFGILGAHSHYEAYTLVGFNRLVIESGRGREYVAKAIYELEQKGRICKKARGRKNGKTDRTNLWLLVEELLAVGVAKDNLETYPHAPEGHTPADLEADVSSAAEQTNAALAAPSSTNVSSIGQDVGSVGQAVSSISPIVSSAAEQEPSGFKPSAFKPSEKGLPLAGRFLATVKPTSLRSEEKGNSEENPTPVRSANATRPPIPPAPPSSAASMLVDTLREASGGWNGITTLEARALAAESESAGIEADTVVKFIFTAIDSIEWLKRKGIESGKDFAANWPMLYSHVKSICDMDCQRTGDNHEVWAGRVAKRYAKNFRASTKFIDD